MYLKRIIGTVTAAAAITAAAVLYTAHPVKSSDHQDTFNLATRANTSADITDVFVFPSPSNPNNVVFAMDVSPLIPAGAGPSKFFDPTLMWQFKISHQASGVEDQVIQLGVSGSDANQTITLYGPGKPNEVGTRNTFVTSIGAAKYNTPTTLQSGSNTIQVFAGPRADPFIFDLFAFFQFLGDKNYGTHTSQSDVGPAANGPLFNGDSAANVAPLTTPAQKAADPTKPSFNGFTSADASNNPGFNSPLGNYACSTSPAMGTLADLAGGFNVLSYVVEVPKSLITTGFGTSVIHVWATVNSSTGN